MFHYYFHLFIYLFELALLVKTLTNFNIIYPKNYRTWKLIIYLT